MPFKPKKLTKKPSKITPSRKTNHEGFLGSNIAAVSMIVYGPEGVGKTEFAAHFPKTMFVVDPKEKGINVLAKRKRCPAPVVVEVAESHNDVLAILKSAANGDYPEVRTLALDSFTGFQNLCFRHHCEEKFDGDFSKEGFFAFQSGPRAAAQTDWVDLLDAGQACVDADITVIYLGHSQIKLFNNPDGPDFDQYKPFLDEACWQQVHRSVDATLFYNFHTEVSKEAKKPRSKAKGTNFSSARYVHTVRTSLFTAKNRFGLSEEIDAGDSGKEAFNNFKADFLKASEE